MRRKEYPFRVGLGVFLPERRLEICSPCDSTRGVGPGERVVDPRQGDFYVVVKMEEPVQARFVAERQGSIMW